VVSITDRIEADLIREQHSTSGPHESPPGHHSLLMLARVRNLHGP